MTEEGYRSDAGEEIVKGTEQTETSQKPFAVELAELRIMDLTPEKVRRLSVVFQEKIIQTELLKAAVESSKRSHIFWPQKGVDWKYKEEDYTSNPGEKEVKNAYGDEIVLMGYGKQLYDFLEAQGFKVTVARGFNDLTEEETKAGMEKLPLYIEADWSDLIKK